jgi:hypothetical protein
MRFEAEEMRAGDGPLRRVRRSRFLRNDRRKATATAKATAKEEADSQRE